MTLFVQKVDNHADSLEYLYRELETVSYLVSEGETSELEDVIGKLAKLEDTNSKIHLCLMNTQRDISFLLRHLSVQSSEQETRREIMQDIETLMSHTTF
jgi:magnesium transporter